MAARSPTNGVGNGSRAERATVVLLDEHPVWLEGLELVLASCGYRVAGKETSPEAALEVLASRRPNLLIASIDFAAPARDGIEFVGRVCERFPTLRVVALSAADDELRAAAAVAAGADCYLPKTAEPAAIVATLRGCLVNAGKPRSSRARELEPVTSAPQLTARELEILQFVALGYTNAQIAERLWVTKWTVKFHLVNAYRKLGVSNRTQAARYVFDHRLPQLPLGHST